MKYNELKRKATELGWSLEREGGNHEIWSHPDKTFKIQLGRHGSEEVKSGLFKKLKKQIGF